MTNPIRVQRILHPVTCVATAPIQTLSGTLDGQQFDGYTDTDDVFEFATAYQVTDGTNTFNIYRIYNDANGGTTVSEVNLDPNAAHAVLAIYNSANFDDGAS